LPKPSSSSSSAGLPKPSSSSSSLHVAPDYTMLQRPIDDDERSAVGEAWVEGSESGSSDADTVQTGPMSVVTFPSDLVTMGDVGDHERVLAAKELAEANRQANQRTKARRDRAKRHRAQAKALAKPKPTCMSLNQERRLRRAKMSARLEWLERAKPGDQMPDEIRRLPCDSKRKVQLDPHVQNVTKKQISDEDIKEFERLQALAAAREEEFILSELRDLEQS